MLQFMAILILFDLIVKLPDMVTVHKLRKSGWKGDLNAYYEWKRI